MFLQPGSHNDRRTKIPRDVTAYQRFRLLDDDFMTKNFEEKIEATELVLCIVLNKPDIRVIKVQTQHEEYQRTLFKT